MSEGKSPVVSIIIPVYNVASYISDALESVFAQDFEDYEVIVVNDGSTDTAELEQVLAGFPHIKYLKQENRGVASARNAALRIAQGQYVAFLDADDVWLPNKLSQQLKFMREGSYDFVYGNALFFGESPWQPGATYMDRSPSKGTVTKESLLDMRCSVPCSTVLARRQAVLDAGMFDENVRVTEDFDLWIRMLERKARGGYQKVVLAKYRFRSAGLSADRIQLHEAALWVLDKVRRGGNLTTPEREALERTTKKLRVLIGLERSKFMIRDGDFEGALQVLRDLRPLNNSFKIFFGRILLRIWPRLVQSIYRYSDESITASGRGLRCIS